MKILLLNPPTRNYHVPENPMLGLLYLASAVRDKHDTWILDLDALKYTDNQMAKRIAKEKPDMIGITCTTYSYSALVKICEIARREAPDAKIVIGGPHVTARPKSSLEESKADYAIIGEGEISFSELADAIERGEEAEERIIVGKKTDDLDELAAPSRDLLEPAITDYIGNAPRHSSPETVTLWSRGCPHNCLFCSNPIYKGQKTRFRSPENIVSELKYLQTLGIREIFVYDDELIGMSPAQNDWMKRICELIEQERIEMSFKCQARCSPFISKETLETMRKAGFRTIMWGCESGSENVLRAIRKGTTTDMIKASITKCKEAGIEAWMFLMIGNPTETVKDAKMTLEMVRECKPDFVQVTYATPFAGEFYDNCASEDLIIEKDPSKWNTNSPVIRSKTMTVAEMEQMRGEIQDYNARKGKMDKLITKLLSKKIPFKDPLSAVYRSYKERGAKETAGRILATLKQGKVRA